MDRNAEYREKVGTVEDMLATLRDADVICGGGELCEPQLFYENFHRVAPRLSDIELIKGKRGSGYVYPFMEMPELRGRLNMELGNEAAAASDFDKAATLSGDYDLYINIYQAYASHGKRADGSDYLERALKIVNTSQADYYNKGLVNYYLQNYDDAKSYLIQALDEDPEDSGSILLLGRVYLALNDVADARAMFNEYVDDPSTAPAAYNGLALCDMEDDDYEKALANVEKGLEYGNSTANRGLLFNEIIIYEHRRDWAMAKAKSAAYIAMYPADEAGLRENEFLSTR